MFLSRLFFFRAKISRRCLFFLSVLPERKRGKHYKNSTDGKGKIRAKGQAADRRRNSRTAANGTGETGQTAAGAEEKARQREKGKSEGRRIRKQGKTGEEKRAKKRGRRGNSKNGRGAGTGKISRFTNLLQIYYNFYKCIIQLFYTMKR